MRHFLALCSGLALCFFMTVGITSATPVPPPGHPPGVRGNQGHGRDNHGRGKDHGNGHGEHARDQRETRRGKYRPAFSYHDRDVIDGYFRRYRSELPPGLAKRGHLPPGLAKHLREGGTLPPGLQKRLRPFPRRLSRELPPLPRGYHRVLLGPRALIISSRNVVIAIMGIPF